MTTAIKNKLAQKLNDDSTLTRQLEDDRVARELAAESLLNNAQTDQLAVGFDKHFVTNDKDVDNTIEVRKLFKGMLPEPSGLGIIKAITELAGVLEKDGAEVLSFDAGLPDHERPKEVQEALHTYADEKFADYSRYPRGEGAMDEASVLPLAAKYHELVVGVKSPESRFVLSEGSTPALNHLIRMQALQQANLDAKTGKCRPLGENCVLETFQLSYALYRLPAEDVNMEKHAEIKLDTTIDIHDGQLIQSQPWKLNRASLSKSFAENRSKNAVFVFSNPANPTGYKLSEDEMNFMADELLNDFQERVKNGMPPKLVLEDIAYITMMRDRTAKPYTLVHALQNKIEEEKRKDQPDEKRIADLLACKQCVVTVHSLSKAAGIPGDRVAYVEGHPDLVGALREKYTRDMLSYANASLYAALGAFAAGKPDDAVMTKYSNRLIALEEGVQKAYFKFADEKKIAFSGEKAEEHLTTTLPFPTKAEGTFFTVMNLKPLMNQTVDDKTIAKIKSYAAKISDPGIRSEFDKAFENHKINDETDLSLYFMFKTLEYGNLAVSTVPQKGQGSLRFALGKVEVADINRAVAATEAFFQNDPLYLEAVKEMAAPTPGNNVQTPVITLDRTGKAHIALT